MLFEIPFIETWYPFKDVRHQFNLSMCATQKAYKNWHDQYRPDLKKSDKEMDKALDDYIGIIYRFYTIKLLEAFERLKDMNE